MCSTLRATSQVRAQGSRPASRRYARTARVTQLRVVAFKEDVKGVSANVKEAREWIATWRAKQQPSKATEAMPAPATTSTTLPSNITLTLQYSVNFGDSVKLVGADPIFGSWDVAAAPAMLWGEGDVWSWSSAMPAGEYDVKAVILRANGSAEWEGGDNRKVVVPGASKLGSSFTAALAWNNTACTELQAAPEVEKPSAAAAAEAEEAAGDESGSEGSEEGGDGKGRGAIVAAAAIQTEETVDSDEEQMVAAGEGYHATEMPLKVADEEEEEQAAQQEQQQQALAATAEGEAAGEDMSAGAQLTAASLGVAAAAVVAWSEYTLAMTGCGLPPGPNGLLGAAEGLSYLSVAGIAGWGLLNRGTKGRGLPGAAAAVEWLSYGIIAAGLGVLAVHVQQYGSIPSALPDDKCYGDFVSPSLAVQQVPAALQDLVGTLQKVSTAGRWLEILSGQ